jgi:hypothetical protein
MPIIPPSLPWIRAAADRMLDPLLDLAAASYVPPRPQPAPSDWVVVIARDGVIDMLSDAMPLDQANQQRAKVIAGTQGGVAVQIIHKSVAARLRVGMLSSAVLDVLESQLDRAYSILLEDRYRRVRF